MADRRFEVTGVSYSFEPSTIEVDEGDEVTIVFTSKRGTHDWVCDDFDARSDRVSTGGTADPVEFVADRVGEFDYYCSVGSHRRRGMEGTLTVNENAPRHAGLLDSGRSEAISISTDRNADSKYVFEKDGQFNPDITVPKGARVELTLTSAGGTHDWVCDDFENARTKRVRTGQSDAADFLADREGNFPYYCSVGSHRKTMNGRLIVVAP